MIHRRLKASLASLLLCTFCAGALLAPGAADAEILKQIPYSYKTKLALSKTPREFRFSLLAESGAVVWSETKLYTLATTQVVSHKLGSVDPLGNPLPVDQFAQQLRVKLEYRTPPAAAWRQLALTTLSVVPYALWSLNTGAVAECTDYYLDADQDGSGVTGDSQCLLAPTGLYTAADAGDLDDTNCLVNPDMVGFLNSRVTVSPEWCNNGRNDDLAGGADDGCDIYFQSFDAGSGAVTGWFDRDGDGYFTNAGETLPVWFGGCVAGMSFTPASPPGGAGGIRGDCDNLDATVYPGAEDLCDGIDQDCGGFDGVAEICANATDDDCDGAVDEAGCR
jgi:hypothetical protein